MFNLIMLDCTYNLFYLIIFSFFFGNSECNFFQFSHFKKITITVDTVSKFIFGHIWSICAGFQEVWSIFFMDNNYNINKNV